MFKPLLEEGIHKKTLEETKLICVLPFTNETNRDIIWQNFLIFIDEIAKFNIPYKLWIDGSFVTDKPFPSDIDITFIAKEEDVDSIMQSEKERFFKIFCDDYFKVNHYCHIEYSLSNDFYNLSSLEDFYTQQHEYESKKGFICIDFGLEP